MMLHKITIFDKFISNLFTTSNRIADILKEKNKNKYKQFTIKWITKKYECVTENEICEITPENMVLQYDAIPRDIKIENQIIQIMESSKNSELTKIKKE